MTYNYNDTGEIGEYLQKIREKYGKSKEIKEITDEIITKFKEQEYPKILIVTDMLITGFDCPQLQTLYLDKPLKDHLLLQTVARVNRPYKEKEAGLIVDYVGVLEDYEKALAFYEKQTSQPYQNPSKTYKNSPKNSKNY